MFWIVSSNAWSAFADTVCLFPEKFLQLLAHTNFHCKSPKASYCKVYLGPPSLKMQTSIWQALDGTKTLDNADSKKVLEAFVNLVEFEQQTVNILIGKGNLVRSVGVLPQVGPHVLRALKQLEAAQNTLAFKLRDEVLSSEDATSLAKRQESLDPSFSAVFEAWSGDSLPQV
jgi:hypothetical protein